MSQQALSPILEKISSPIGLFETEDELNRYLKKTIKALLDAAEASFGALFIHDKATDELKFRVGYDKGNLWDGSSELYDKLPSRFALQGNEMGETFSSGTVKTLHYPENTTDHPFRSKILVPIIRGPEKLGILMMAHTETESFDHLDKEDLVVTASRLGDILNESMILLGGDHSEETTEVPRSRIVKGIKASDGFVEGKALPIWSDMKEVVKALPPAGSKEEELERLEAAVRTSLDQLDEMGKSTSSVDVEMVSLIFTAQFYMLKDESFTGKMKRRIEKGESAPRSVRLVVEEYARRFASISEERIAEKAQDVRDLGFRILSNMGSSRSGGFSYKDKIVLSRHIYPTDLFRLAMEGASGLILRGSTVTAHISILARSLKLPVLITPDKGLLKIPADTALLLDATEGKLYVQPRQETRKKLIARRNKKSEAPTFYSLKGRTSDGTRVQVSANINLYTDATEAVTQGAEGIGLYRSEFPFILKNDFLSEEQQYRIYRNILNTQGRRPVIMRTADIGGDKLMQGRGEGEANPFLGVRGIRFSLANPEMLRDQLKAMMRAGYKKDLGIMLPMVSDVEEVLQVKEQIDLCRDHLKQRGVSFNSTPRVGAMVELPSAAMAIKDLAQETDFLSIGTNDLTMYLLAVDRTNEKLSHLYRSHHPSVLRVFAFIASGCGNKLPELSVCGDVASDPLLVPFFVGLGIRKLSVTPAQVEPVKQILNLYSLEETKQIARDIVSIRRVSEMDEYIRKFHLERSLAG